LPRWRFGLVKHTKSTACKIAGEGGRRPDEGADLELILIEDVDKLRNPRHKKISQFIVLMIDL